MLEDRVQLPRLYLLGDAAGLRARRRSARRRRRRARGRQELAAHKRLVYELQVAQDVSAGQGSQGLASTFAVVVTARSGHTLEEIRRLVDEEIAKLQAAPPSERELQRFQNRTEAGFFDRLERVGGFGGKADQLNLYYFRTGDPDYFEEDLALPRARPERRAGGGLQVPRRGAC